MMVDTGIVIGGGLATHVLAKEAGHAVGYLPEASDIDFYVYGCLPPKLPAGCCGSSDAANLFANPVYAKYISDCRSAKLLKDHVMRTFFKFTLAVGYEQTLSDEDASSYAVEYTAEGDRLFTTTGKVGYSVLFLTRSLGEGEPSQKLNLVFVDTPLHTVMTKVDLGLTAGFLTASCFNQWMYHHAKPEDINTLSVRWLQPESTHTTRQRARMFKYSVRYNTTPLLTMTIPKFIADYDTLPEDCKITLLVDNAEQIKEQPVDRRIRGLSNTALFYYQLPDRLPILV
jgi:hypothetical protein